MRTLTRDEARDFYDRFGRRQDAQAAYEDVALDALVAHARFDGARAVFEFGCGTGRFARRLLDSHLPATATYAGVDLSATMIGLARQRLAPFGDRATATLSDGSPRQDAAGASVDRFVSTYVLDLLPEAEIRAVVDEAHRLLAPGGLLAVTGLTRGATPVSRLVTALWRFVHRLRPRLVGGCRPIVARDFLDDARWEVVHHGSVVARGLTSEVLVAEKT